MPSHDRSPGLRWPARQVNAALDSYSLGASCQRLENDTNTAYSDGQGINTLTSAEPGPPNGGAVFHDTAVWIKAA